MSIMKTPLELAKALEKKHSIPMWRHCWVIPAEHNNGKKKYLGESPAKTAQQIAEGWASKNGKSQIPGRGYVDKPVWMQKDSDDYDIKNAYRAVSIYLKFVRDLFVVDFDSKDLCNEETNALFKFCIDSGTIFIETAKGFHFYFYIIDCPDFTSGLKIEADDSYGEVDLMGRKNVPGSNNIIEGEHHKIFNGESIDNIPSIPWSDMKKWFNLKKLMGSDKKTNDGLTRKEKNETQAILMSSGEDLPELKFRSYLDRLLGRWGYEMFCNVGIICWNNFRNRDQGFKVWMDWVFQDPMYHLDASGEPQDHTYRNLSYLMDMWGSFKEKATPLTWKTLRKYANEDDPATNVYQEIYDQSGGDGLIEYMNSFLAFNIKNSEIIFVNPNDNSRYASPSYYKPADAKPIWEKWMVKTKSEDEPPKIKMVNPLTMWMRNNRRRDVNGISFDASPHPDPNYFNLFPGLDISKEDVYDLDLQDAMEEVAPLLEHIYDIWCHGNDLHYAYVMDWFAHIIQKPHIKIGVLLCVKSKEGSGKGIIFEFMKTILGGRLMAQINSLDLLIGKNNSVLEGRLLINGDEIIWGGSIKDGNALKGLITETEVWISEKWRVSYKLHNTTAFCFASNETNCMSAREGDRRSVGFELKNTWAGRQKTPAHKAYFCNISGMPNSTHGIQRKKAEAFAKILYSRDLTSFNPANPPLTDFVSQQIQQNWAPPQKFWHNVLLQGGFSIDDKFKKKKSCLVTEGDFTKTMWTDYDESQLIWGNVSEEFGNGFKDLVEIITPTQLPIVGYCYLNRNWDANSGSSDSLQSRWFSVLQGFNDDKIYDLSGVDIQHIPIPDSFIKFYMMKSSGGKPRHRANFAENWVAESKTGVLVGFTPSCVQEKGVRPKWGRIYNVGKTDNNACPIDYPSWHYDCKDLDWHIGDGGDHLSFVDVLELMEEDDEESPVIDHQPICYLRKMGDDVFECSADEMDFNMKVLKISNMESFDNYIKKWSLGVNKDNFHEDLVERFWFKDDGEQGFLTSKTIQCKRWVYDKEWIYEKYLQSLGAGYKHENTDYNAFWAVVKEMLGGDYDKLDPRNSGKYYSCRIQRSGTDRKQFVNFVDLQIARREFEKWTGRLIDWEDEVEGDVAPVDLVS